MSHLPKDLAGVYPGQVVIHLETTSSTNDAARRLAQQGASSGTVVVADEQTAGRGRRGRRWQARRGEALLCSILLRPSLAPAQGVRLTMLSAVAVAGALRCLGLQAAIKWPNDVLLSGRKTAGILVESESAGERMIYAVAGIGVNVNTPAPELATISPQATSLLVEAGHLFSRRRVLRLLLAEFWSRFADMERDGGEAVFSEWRALLDTLGRDVTVTVGDEVISGKAEDVAGDGSLIVHQESGRLVRVTYGDVA
jgi:BirA family transcriptional regulator, biotin operon repressor / biotin---[acetyl-CoA-carboxylase] ligase